MPDASAILADYAATITASEDPEKWALYRGLAEMAKEIQEMSNHIRHMEGSLNRLADTQ